MTDRPSAGRTYTNVVLTVIATLLAVQAVQQSPLSIVSEAQAQSTNRRAGTDTTIPATQDVAVAAATNDVAAANRDIAASIKQVASAIEGLGGAMRSVAAAVTEARASAPKPATSAPANPSDISISVK
jgi:hypothetical protein